MYWVFLVVGAILTLAYVAMKIRSGQLATSDAVFWFLLALAFIVIAVFPQLVYWLSGVLGFESPSNFVFLCVLVVIVYRQLSVSVENARLRGKIVQLTQALALSGACRREEAAIMREEQE